jgi:hypothetical protein
VTISLFDFLLMDAFAIVGVIATTRAALRAVDRMKARALIRVGNGRGSTDD